MGVTPRCSFCGKWASDVKVLIAGPVVLICNECVELSQEIIEEQFPGPVVWHCWPSAQGATVQYFAFQGGRMRAEICLRNKGSWVTWRLAGRDASQRAKNYEAARQAAENIMRGDDERAARARRESAQASGGEGAGGQRLP